MIPWLIIAELISESELFCISYKRSFNTFKTSGEINFMVDNTSVALENVMEFYRDKAIAFDERMDKYNSRLAIYGSNPIPASH